MSSPIPLEVTLGNQSVIPVSVQLTTNTGQFTLGMIVALIGAFGFILLMFFPVFLLHFRQAFVKLKLKELYKGTGRRAILINHNKQDFLNVQMITMETAYKVASAMSKFKGQAFDLILNTPGGDVYATQFISRLLKAYPGNVRATVPMMAASGGTLLALSCKSIQMSKTAVLGPIDPQLGVFWDIGSSRSWGEVIRRKGKKSDDSSIRHAFLGEQVTRTMFDAARNLLVQNHGLPFEKADIVAKCLTDGRFEHIFQMERDFLYQMGLKIGLMDDSTTELFHKILSKKLIQEVVAV